MAGQNQRIVDPHLLGYPIPYMIDYGKVKMISVRKYGTSQNLVLMNPETGFRNALYAP